MLIARQRCGAHDLRASREHVGQGGGSNPRHGRIRDRGPGRPPLGDQPRPMDGSPHAPGVGAPTAARRLMQALGRIAGLKRPWIGDKEAAGALVSSFPPVHLELHAAAERRVVDRPQERPGPKDAADGGQRRGAASGRRTPGAALAPDRHGRGPGAPRGRDPDQGVLLVREQRPLGCAMDHRIEVAILLGGIRWVEVWCVSRERGQQGLPPEGTQATKVSGKARRIDPRFLGPQDRLVVQPPVQHRQGCAHGAGPDRRMTHARLVGDRGGDRPGPVVIPDVARGERTAEGTGVETAPWPIGRGAGPIAPHRAPRQTVVGMHHDRVRGCPGSRPETPLRPLWPPVGGHPCPTRGHRGEAEMWAVGDAGRQPRPGTVREAGGPCPRGANGTGAATPGLDLPPAVGTPPAWPRPIDGPAAVGESGGGDLQGLTPFHLPPAVANGHHGLVGQSTGRLGGDGLEVPLATGEHGLWGLGERPRGLGMRPCRRPAGGIGDPRRQGDGPSTGRTLHVPGASAISHRRGASQVPWAPLQGAVPPRYGRPTRPGDNRAGGPPGPGRQRACSKLADAVQARPHRCTPGVAVAGERQQGWESAPETGVSRPPGLALATLRARVPGLTTVHRLPARVGLERLSPDPTRGGRRAAGVEPGLAGRHAGPQARRGVAPELALACRDGVACLPALRGASWIREGHHGIQDRRVPGPQDTRRAGQALGRGNPTQRAGLGAGGAVGHRAPQWGTKAREGDGLAAARVAALLARPVAAPHGPSGLWRSFRQWPEQGGPFPPGERAAARRSRAGAWGTAPPPSGSPRRLAHGLGPRRRVLPGGPVRAAPAARPGGGSQHGSCGRSAAGHPSPAG